MGDGAGKEGGGRTESSMETCTLPCVTQTARDLLYDSGSSNRCSVTIWRGKMRSGWEAGARSKREGTHVHR